MPASNGSDVHPRTQNVNLIPRPTQHGCRFHGGNADRVVGADPAVDQRQAAPVIMGREVCRRGCRGHCDINHFLFEVPLEFWVMGRLVQMNLTGFEVH